MFNQDLLSMLIKEIGLYIDQQGYVKDQDTNFSIFK